jgi:hypothetical protein
VRNLNIERPWAYFGLIRKLKVWVDDKEVGAVKANQSFDFNLESGIHKIQVSMDWCKSTPHILNITDSGTVYCTVKTIWFPLCLFLTLFLPSKVFKIHTLTTQN